MAGRTGTAGCNAGLAGGSAEAGRTGTSGDTPPVRGMLLNQVADAALTPLSSRTCTVNGNCP